MEFDKSWFGLGVILGIIALILLINKASNHKEYWAYSIYGTSIIILFLASTLYHSFSLTKLKDSFRKIDHSSIFVLISGTYTPYFLVGIGGNKGMWLFGFMWTIALLGILFKLFFFDLSKKFGPFIYLAMGWICAFIMKDIYAAVGLWGIILLGLGGLSYTAGVYFYLNKKMKFSHVIWHLFVLAGAIFMYFSIYCYL